MINAFDLYQQAIICSVFGLLSLATMHCIFCPQIVQIIKTKNTSGSSLTTYILTAICWMFWCIWANGFYFNNMSKGCPEGIPLSLFMCQYMPAVISDTLSAILSIFLVCLKVWHVTRAKKMNLTELQLADFLMNKQKKKYLNDSKFNKLKTNLPSILAVLIAIILGGVIAIIFSFATSPVTPFQPLVPDWEWVIVVNFIGAAISEVLSWPQFIKCIWQKDTTSISTWWALFFVISNITFLIYNLLLSFGTGEWSNVALFSMIFAGYIPNIGVLIFKLKNKLNAKKRNMTEVEYTKKVLIPQVKQKEAAKRKKKI